MPSIQYSKRSLLLSRRPALGSLAEPLAPGIISRAAVARGQIAHHDIHDGQQLAHASGRGDFLTCAYGEHTRIQRFAHRIRLGSDQRPPVQHGANLAPAPVHGAAPTRAAVRDYRVNGAAWGGF